jgi:hypothetical protein
VAALPPGQWPAIVRETFDNYAWVLPAVCIRHSSKAGAETIGENAFLSLQGGLAPSIYQHEKSRAVAKPVLHRSQRPTFVEELRATSRSRKLIGSTRSHKNRRRLNGG